MKVIFHEFFYPEYTSDPAAEAGRMEAIIAELPDYVDMVTAEEASEAQINAAHTLEHMKHVRSEAVYDIAALAAGGAIQAARIGLTEPAFAAIRPPGHHASGDSCWGFCYFNNMAVALLALRGEGLIETALVLDFDLHYGDGTENILGGESWVSIHNPAKDNREDYLAEVEAILAGEKVDMIGISAGFDNHLNDWGGLMHTEDYRRIGEMVRARGNDAGCGYFALFEGGYNHNVLGKNARALIEGLSGR